ncbi:MAG: YhjD/YihY/BrkB family envelope integrity protein, partial [Rhodothermales bacterium]
FWGARALFIEYLRRFADYDAVYGPVSLVIVLVFWVWIGGLILLFGGQLVSHYQEILVDSEDPDRVDRRHEEAREKRERPGQK